MSLEIAGRAWTITPEGGGGVVMEALAERVEVRLVGDDDCRVYASLDAAPGSAHIIRFAADGSVGLEDVTGGFLDMGPALVERDPSNC